MVEDSINPDPVVALAAGIDMTSMEIRVGPDSDLESTLQNVPPDALTVIPTDADTWLAIWGEGGVATAEIQQNPDDAVVRQSLD